MPKGVYLHKPHTEEWKKQMSILHKKIGSGNRLPIHRGEKHYRWKGGITSENLKIRNSLEMKLWRKAVFERDKYACIWCGAGNKNGQSTRLNADHIKPFAQYPELRFAIDNGRTLCFDCHKTTDSFGRRSKSIKNLNN